MWSRSSPTRQCPFRAVSTSTRLPASQGSDARAPTLTSSLGLRSTSNRSRPIRPYRPRPPNADFRWSSSPASSELDLVRLALVRARCSRRRPKASTIKLLKRVEDFAAARGKTDKPRVNVDNSPAAEAGMGRQYRYNGRRSGLLMPTVPDPDLVPFEPPDHPTIRAAFRNVIESYPRALYDGQGLVRYRTRFLDSVLVSEPELIRHSCGAGGPLSQRRRDAAAVVTDARPHLVVHGGRCGLEMAAARCRAHLQTRQAARFGPYIQHDCGAAGQTLASGATRATGRCRRGYGTNDARGDCRHGARQCRCPRCASIRACLDHRARFVSVAVHLNRIPRAALAALSGSVARRVSARAYLS